MRIGLIAALAATVAFFAAWPAAAQGIDMAAMEKWAKVQIVHYEAVGEFRQKQVQIPAVDADLYADVVERVHLSFDWDQKKKVIAGTPKIRNEAAVVSNIVGIDKKCPYGKLNGAYEHFEVDEIKQARPGEALELVGRRVHPDTMVSESCSSKLRLFKGAVKPAKEYIAPAGPEMLAMAKMMPAGGPFTVTPDGKSIVMKAQNSNWVWTFTPTAK
jgi:hypothetical protein